MSAYRKTVQPLLPKHHEPRPPGEYDIYPAYSLGGGKIEHGFLQLVSHLIGHSKIVIDGYGGVLWDHFRNQLDQALSNRGAQARWVSVEKALRPSQEIEALVEPFLGGDDPIFGRRFTGTLADFFDPRELKLETNDSGGIRSSIMELGRPWSERLTISSTLMFQRMRMKYRPAGSIRNLGATQVSDPGTMYKRFYFVDWAVLNAHKAALLPNIDSISTRKIQKLPRPLLVVHCAKR